jgi:ribosomal protein S18 acetylase RimI-like enzyme
MNAAERTMRTDAAAFTLLVDAKNDRAVAFYQRYGFRALASQPRTLFLPLATAQSALKVPEGGRDR